MADFEKYVQGVSDKVAGFVTQSMKVVKATTETQTAKLKLRSEIGQNQRDITKAYTRLGEAYFEAQENGAEMSNVNDLLELVRSKKKVVDLLQEKLNALSEAEEEKTEETEEE